MMKRFARIGMLVLGIAALPLGCEDDHDHGTGGVPTGSDCPTPQTLTYANFGQAFFATYCQRCHASSVTGAARMGAPSDHTFDMVQDIQLLTEHIDELAAAGPDAVNTEMPPDGAKPTEAERLQLGEWLACGAPQ
jgi:cytochrome c5